MSGLVSIIMPVYNGQAFLVEAIDSVLAQTYSNWELIIVDDGSTDNTPAIVSAYTDPRIVKIRQENRGEAGARNTGLNMARGEYVACLDADDLYLASALAALVDYLESNQDVDVVFSDGYFCDVTGRLLMRVSEHRPGLYAGDILEPLVLNPSVVAIPCSTLFRRLSAETLGLRYDTQLSYGVDWDFWIQLARFYRYGYLPKLTCMYRIHGTNMTSSVSSRRRKHDLVVGRLKVMNSDWFKELSLGTRREFFYHLLIGLLSNDPGQQQTTMKAPAFQMLPVDLQADLLRLVAGNHLTKRRETEFAIECLRQSLQLQPNNRKGRVLLRLADTNPALAAAVLSAWKVGHRAQTRVRTLGQRRPKPVPAALMPASE
jgi:glycosyltransferase involved in cell wall biosynthesis